MAVPDGARNPGTAASASRGYRLLVAVVRLLLRASGWRVRVTGAENVPRRGGAVLTWAHTSHVDFVVTALAVWDHHARPCRLLAMEELWSSPLFGWVPRAAGAIRVDRVSARGRVQALRDARARIEAGELVLLAPEGTISPSFELLPHRAGAVRLAQRTGVPVVPSASWGTHRFSTTGHGPHWWSARGIPVEIAFGAPLHVGPDDDTAAATVELARRTEDLLHHLQETYGDGAPAGAWWVPARLGGGAPDHEVVLRGHRSGQPFTRGGLRHRRHDAS